MTANDTRIKQLKTRIRHLENELKITQQENTESSQKYFELFSSLEKTVKERTKALEQAREELKQQNESLESLLKRAEEANIAKSEFLANISHELKTPLNSIMGFSDLLKNRLKDPKNREYLDNIYGSGSSLLQLINDIIDLSRIESGNVTIDKCPINIKQLLKESHDVYANKALEKGIDFQIELPVDFPKNVIFDATRLRQIVTNLVGNAVKFTSRGYIRLRLSFTPVEQGKIDIEINVEDSGIGIEKDKLESIFSAFKQEHSADNKSYEGIGLGLAICKRLVNTLNGSITVKSKANRGTCFTVRFKDLEVYEDEAATDNSIGGGNKYSSLSGKTILVADDSSENRKIIDTFLSFIGCKVIHAEDGAEAIKCVREEKPDLVLMDLQMPVLSGIDAMRILKSNDETTSIPLVALTARDESEIRKQCSAAGCVDFIGKPFERDGLYHTLDNVLTQAPESSQQQLESVLESPEHKRDIEKFLVKLENEYSSHIKELGETMLINDLLELVGGLKSEAVRHPLDRLNDWIAETESFCKSYNVDRLAKNIARYDFIVSDIRKQLEN